MQYVLFHVSCILFTVILRYRLKFYTMAVHKSRHPASEYDRGSCGCPAVCSNVCPILPAMSIHGTPLKTIPGELGIRYMQNK